MKNLTVYGGQPIDSVLGSPIGLVEMINQGLLDRFQRQGNP